VLVLSVLAKNIFLHYFFLRTPWQQLAYPGGIRVPPVKNRCYIGHM